MFYSICVLGLDLLQVLNVAKYEKEICKLKEKVNEIDFYKSRVEVRSPSEQSR